MCIIGCLLGYDDDGIMQDAPSGRSQLLLPSFLLSSITTKFLSSEPHFMCILAHREFISLIFAAVVLVTLTKRRMVVLCVYELSRNPLSWLCSMVKCLCPYAHRRTVAAVFCSQCVVCGGREVFSFEGCPGVVEAPRYESDIDGHV